MLSKTHPLLLRERFTNAKVHKKMQIKKLSDAKNELMKQKTNKCQAKMPA